MIRKTLDGPFRWVCLTLCMHVLTMGSVSQSTGKEHSVFYARLLSRPAKTLHKTLLSLFNDCETIACGVLVWCCHVYPPNSTEVLGLGGFFWTQVMNTVEAVKSANSCMEMQPDSPNCQRVWESPSVHAFGLWCGWEQSEPMLSVFHFCPHSHFILTKSIWRRLRGGL